MCTAIDKKFFYQPSVLQALEAGYIPVRINGGDSNDAQIASLMKQFNVVGFPTILIVDPTNEQILKRWASDLYDYSVAELITELEHKEFN